MIGQLKNEVDRVLHIWEERSFDRERKIFWTLGCDNKPLRDGRRSAVLMARILWAYSAAYELVKKDEWKELADLAFSDLYEHYRDQKNGGVYEMLDRDGEPLCRDKVIYTQSYSVYACAQYYKISGNRISLEFAEDIFKRIEDSAWSDDLEGYLPLCGENWEPFENWNDRPELKGKFVVDTFLHLIESYTVLYKVWKDPELEQAVRRLAGILTGRFLRENGALYQELSLEWTPLSDLSDRYGDEAECSWMLCEAAAALNDQNLNASVKQAVEKMLDNICRDGFDETYGGVYDRKNTDGTMSTDKLWWEESESVIALLYGYRLLKKQEYLEKAENIWNFIQKYIMNMEDEWNWKVEQDGTAIPVVDPADPLKCPYHNTRLTVLAVPVLEDIRKAGGEHHE